MRIFAFLIGTLAVSLSYGQTLHYTITQNDTPLGENTYELKPDGTFNSVSKIAIASTKIDSTITGKLVNGLLTNFEMKQTAPGSAVTINYADGKVSAVVNGKPQAAVLAKMSKSLYSNYHPGIASTILENLKSAGPEAQTVSLAMIDNGGVPFEAKVVKGTPRTISVDGKEVQLRPFKVVIAAVEIEYAVREDGMIVAENVPAQKLKMIADGYDAAFEDPVLKYKELSQPTFKTKTLKAVKVKMRDGVTLVQDIVMPDAEGRFPTILTRTPYGRMGSLVGAEWWAKRGYVFISQDCRGRHDSEGKWDPFAAERKDGKDAIDWIAAQPWSDKKVGMIGASYGGYVQWAAAVEQPAALKCIIPQVSPPDAMRNLPFDNGIFMLTPSLWWSNLIREKETHMERASQPLPHPEKMLTLPLSKIDDAVLGVNVPFFDEWLKREGMAKWKGSFDTISSMPKVKIPALHISGWWDGDGIGTKLNWATMRASGNPNQWLIYGPWAHGFNVSTKFGDVEYGPTAVRDLDSIYLRWFDTWLKGKNVNLTSIPKVQAFVTGRNSWSNMTDWPEQASKEKLFYLSENFVLKEAPSTSAKTATYVYDPSKAKIPDATKASQMTEPSTVVDLKKDTGDGLVYKSAPFTEAIALGGPVSLDLSFSTNVVATDFFAMIMDIDEKGVARMIGLPGKIDVRYLNGLEAPKLIKPGQIYKAKIELWDTAHEFKKGHRLALFVTSTMFPGYARNLNTGEPVFSATKMKVAKQVIYQDAKRASVLRLRVLK